MKRGIILTILVLMFMGPILTVSVSAEENIEAIAINEENFPSEYIRDILYDHYDYNGDYYLKGYEIDKVKAVEKLYINPANVFGDSNVENINNKYSVLDCKGLDIFENVKELYIYVAQEGKNYGIKNFDVLYNMKKVRKLTISGDTSVKQYDFSKFPKLKYLEMNNVKNVDKVIFGQKSNIEKISLYDVGGKVNLNLARANKLKEIAITDYRCKGIKFGTNKSLIKIRIWSSSGNNNKTLNNIDVSGLKNLKTFYLDGAKQLKNIKFGQLNKIKYINISGCKKLKKLDVNKCKNAKEIRIYENAIKKVDVSNLKKLSVIGVEKNTKVIVRKGQKIKLIRYKKGMFWKQAILD